MATGAGGVHHVAFRIPDADYKAWAERLNHVRMPSSGPVDRFWFRSLYFREPNGILFEIATDGPGFATDEPMDTLGETLSLPPFLEGRPEDALIPQANGRAIYDGIRPDTPNPFVQVKETSDELEPRRRSAAWR
jgi:hypothetical protein